MQTSTPAGPTGRIWIRYIVQLMDHKGNVRGMMRIVPDEFTLHSEIAKRFPGTSMFIVSARPVEEHADGIGCSVWFPIDTP